MPRQQDRKRIIEVIAPTPNNPNVTILNDRLRRQDHGNCIIYLFQCPACNHTHQYQTKAPQTNGAEWEFNGNHNKPSFQPSLKVTTGFEEGDHICHLHLTDGKLIFCGDCSHDMSGKTVDLPELPEGWMREI